MKKTGETSWLKKWIFKTVFLKSVLFIQGHLAKLHILEYPVSSWLHFYSCQTKDFFFFFCFHFGEKIEKCLLINLYYSCHASILVTFYFSRVLVYWIKWDLWKCCSMWKSGVWLLYLWLLKADFYAVMFIYQCPYYRPWLCIVSVIFCKYMK